MWELCFDHSEPFYIKDRLGLNYIHHLLSHPNRPINVIELRNHYSKTSDQVQGSIEKALDHDFEEGGLPNIDGHMEEKVLDDRTMNDIRVRIKEIAEDIRVLREDGFNDDSELIQEKLDKMNALKDYGSAGTDKYGKLRTITIGIERARKSVQKAISESLQLIDQHDNRHTFFGYLKKSIETGNQCLYKPPHHNPPDWSL